MDSHRGVLKACVPGNNPGESPAVPRFLLHIPDITTSITQPLWEEGLCCHGTCRRNGISPLLLSKHRWVCVAKARSLHVVSLQSMAERHYIVCCLDVCRLCITDCITVSLPWYLWNLLASFHKMGWTAEPAQDSWAAGTEELLPVVHIEGGALCCLTDAAQRRCMLWDSGILEKLFPLEWSAFYFTAPSGSTPAISCEELWLLTFLLLSLIIISWQVFLHPHDEGGAVPCAVILVLRRTCCSWCRVSDFLFSPPASQIMSNIICCLSTQLKRTTCALLNLGGKESVFVYNFTFVKQLLEVHSWDLMDTTRLCCSFLQW